MDELGSARLLKVNELKGGPVTSSGHRASRSSRSSSTVGLRSKEERGPKRSRGPRREESLQGHVARFRRLQQRTWVLGRSQLHMFTGQSGRAGHGGRSSHCTPSVYDGGYFRTRLSERQGVRRDSLDIVGAEPATPVSDGARTRGVWAAL